MVSEADITTDDSEEGRDGITKLDNEVLSMLWVGVGIIIAVHWTPLEVRPILRFKNIIVSEYMGHWPTA